MKTYRIKSRTPSQHTSVTLIGRDAGMFLATADFRLDGFATVVEVLDEIETTAQVLAGLAALDAPNKRAARAYKEMLAIEGL